MFIPGLKTVGGFSMCSAPHQLTEKGTLNLAVKVAKWPPAHWLHTKVCRFGKIFDYYMLQKILRRYFV